MARTFLTLLLLSTSQVVTAACSVNTNNLSFGDYDSLSGIASTTIVNLSVSCTSGQGFIIRLDSGINSSSTSNRKMKHSSSPSTLNYNLYSNSTHTLIWGNGGEGNLPTNGTGTGSPINYTIFGKTPAGQSLPLGAYSDVITISVDF